MASDRRQKRPVASSAGDGQASHAAKRRKVPGLSLEHFAKAKLSTYDRQQVTDKKQALLAGRVNKYKKLKKKLAPEGSQYKQSTIKAHELPDDSETNLATKEHQQARGLDLADTHGEDGVDLTETSAAPSQQKQKHKQKKKATAQRLAEEAKLHKAEERAARDAAVRAAQERRIQIQQREQERKQQTTLMRKRTRTGQPVMKHRIDKILAQLQSEKANDRT